MYINSCARWMAAAAIAVALVGCGSDGDMKISADDNSTVTNPPGGDDGIEFFGGAVEVNNFIARYVRDDSIDYADGRVGAVRGALVIHSARNRGNR